MIRLLPSCVFVLLCLVLLNSEGRTQWISYETRVVADNLNVPWEIEWGYDDWIWFTERSGRFSKINPETGERKILLVLPFADHSDAEKGTLGFAFHPDFPITSYLYIAYNYKKGDKTAFNVVRWKYEADTLIEPTTLIDNIPTGQIHNGSRVKVGPDRKLYISTGEADIKLLAQDVSSASGKILRLNLDGSIPSDNPYPGNPIWSLGHRNPQGLDFGPTGLLYSTEHGHASDDELNLITKGGNYGWPMVEGDCDRHVEFQPCDSLNTIAPLMLWTPTVAVTGIEYFAQPTFPEWSNSLLMATLKDQSLWVLKLAPDGKSVIASYRYPLVYSEDESEIRRLRDYCFSPDGRLFVSTSNIWSAQWNPDRIIEIKRVGVIPFELTMITPASGSVVTESDVRVSWQQAAGDSRYQMQISTLIGFEGALVADRELTDTAYRVSLASSESFYYWRVRELTSMGPWSAPDSFKVDIKSETSAVAVAQDLVAYPNPATAAQSITLRTSELIESGTIVDAGGRLIRSISLDELTAKLIDTKGLTTGSYFISLSLSRSRTRLIPIHVVK